MAPASDEPACSLQARARPHQPRSRQTCTILARGSRRGRRMTMRVAVIGAGIVGVTTAYELAADGHEVTVFERRGSVAAEASFANAGVVAPGYVTPWAAPGMPAKVLRHLLGRHAPVRLRRLRRAGADCPGCGAGGAPAGRRLRSANRARMQRLAHFSRERLLELTRDAAARLRAAARATWCCCAARATWRWRSPGWRCCASWACRYEWSTPRAAAPIEPGLNPDTAAARRHPPAARRGRQLPPVRPPAEGRGAAPGRARFRVRAADVSRAVHARRRAPRPGRRSRRPAADDFDAVRACAPASQANAAAAAARPAAAAGCRCTATRSPRRCGTSTATRTSGRARR